MRNIPRWLMVSVGVSAAIIGVFIGSGLGSRIDQTEVNRDIADAIYQNCLADLERAQEYRTRAIVEQRIIETMIGTNEALIEVVNAFPDQKPLSALGQQLDVQNVLLTDQLSLINIIPLPECNLQREKIQQTIDSN